MSWTKIIAINILIGILLLAAVELVSSWAFFRVNSTHQTFATEWLTEGLAKRLDHILAVSKGGDMLSVDTDVVFISPKDDSDKTFRSYLLSEYEKHFTEFARITKESGSALVILWSPSDKTKDISSHYEAYFKKLAEDQKATFVSMNDFFDHDREDIFLIPYNGHLTRLANKLIATKLAATIQKLNPPKTTGFVCDDIRGRFSPNKSALWPMVPEVPYILSTDKFGFRRTIEGDYDTHKPTILVAGDSFSFGPYLPFYDTYPGFLARKMPAYNVINGGVSGFGIRAELSLLKKNIRCLKPALVVLQVLDNDITDTAVYKYNLYNFDDSLLEPPEAEKEYIKRSKALEQNKPHQ